MRNFALATAFALVLVASGSLPAGAEIFRCVGPDGAVSYTSRADACPGAKAHEPSGRIQSVPSSKAPTARRSPAAARSGGVQSDAAQAAAWRAKRVASEEQRARLAKNVESYRRIVTGCNRGSHWWITDEHGIKRRLTCEESRAKHEELQGRLAKLDEYLSRGLAEECRRAGCLPGWLR